MTRYAVGLLLLGLSLIVSVSSASSACKGNGKNACTPTPTATVIATPTHTPTATPTVSSTPTHRPITVAVLDTGCQYAHAGLQGGNVDPTQGWTAPWLDYPALPAGDDDSVDGHGTRVCGIITNVASNNLAAVVSYKVCAAYGFPFQQCGDQVGSDEAGVVSAIDRAVAAHVRVINASTASSSLNSPLISAAVQRACDAGIVVVAAAGNTANPAAGQYDDGVWPLSNTNPCMIVVGGSDTNGDGSLTSWPNSIRSMYVDVTARPVGIVTTACRDDYVQAGIGPCFVTNLDGSPVMGAGSGTSFATPLVTGTVVRMLVVNPALTPARVESLLRQTATPLSDCAIGCGAGQINADAAVTAAIP